MNDGLDLLKPYLPLSCSPPAEATPDDRLAKAIRVLGAVSNTEYERSVTSHQHHGPSLLRHILADLKKHPLIIVPSGSSHWNAGCLDFDNFQQLMASPICPMTDAEARSAHQRIVASLTIRGSLTKIFVIPMAQVVKLKDADWDAVISICLTGAEWEWNQLSQAFVDGAIRKNIRLWFMKSPEKSTPPFIQNKEDLVRVVVCGSHLTHGGDFWCALREHLSSKYEADDNMDL